MKKNRPGFFTKIYYSIAGFEKYRCFLRQSTGRAAAYLILFSLIISAIIFIPQQIEFIKWVDYLSDNFDSIVPEFSFSGGKLEVDAQMPIVINSGGMYIVINTLPDAEDELVEYDNVLLITSNKIIQKAYTNKNNINLSVFSYLTFTSDDLKQYLPYMKPVISLMFIFAIILFICSRFVMSLIVSVIGLVFSSSKRTDLSYRSIFKLSVYSITLPTLLLAVISFIPVQIPFINLIYYTIAFIYLLGAINIIKKNLDNLNSGIDPS